MKKYLITSGLLTGVLLVAHYFFNASLFNSWLHGWFPALVIFFSLQSIPIAWLLRESEKGEDSSPLYILGSIVFRMVTGLFVLVFFYFLKVPDLITFSIQFLAVYLVYLIFELIIVLSNLRRNSIRSKN